MTEQIDYDPNTVLEALNNKADRDLNNVTDGTYQVLTTKNITNCITKIPQDIKLEISNETVTLKSGSVLRKADGTTIIVNEDKSISVAALTRKSLIGYSDNGLYVLTVENFFSRDTAPDNYNIMVWLDTATKTIKYTTNKGVNWTERGDTLPLGEISSKTSIDQIFNCFGYIGSTAFVLPGVEGLIPVGKNVNGSLNNKKQISVMSVKIFSVAITNGIFAIDGNGILQTGNTLVYDSNKNLNYLNGTTLAYWCNCGTFSTDSTGRITSFNPKATFQAIDRNDKEEIISWGMPDLTAGVNLTSGTTIPVNSLVYVASTRSAGNLARAYLDGEEMFKNEGGASTSDGSGATFLAPENSIYTSSGNFDKQIYYPLKGEI